MASGSAEKFVEVPLNRWADVRGSKLKAGPMLKAGLDVLAMAARRKR